LNLSPLAVDGRPFSGVNLIYASAIPSTKAPAPRMLDRDTGETLLTTTEAASVLGVSPRTLEGFRRKGGGPAFVAISRNLVRYQPTALDTWIASRSAPHTAKARALLS